MNGLAQSGSGRVVARGRAFERHLQEALDTECVECAGTLHVWRSEHKNLEGRPSLHQAVVCLHCNLRYVRVLMVPQPNALGRDARRFGATGVLELAGGCRSSGAGAFPRSTIGDQYALEEPPTGEADEEKIHPPCGE